MNLALYCTVQEAADMAGVTPKYVRHLLAKKTIRGEKIAGVWLVLRADAEKFVRIPGMGRPPATKARAAKASKPAKRSRPRRK
jgi:hypothetical protein